MKSGSISIVLMLLLLLFSSYCCSSHLHRVEMGRKRRTDIERQRQRHKARNGETDRQTDRQEIGKGRQTSERQKRTDKKKDGQAQAQRGQTHRQTGKHRPKNVRLECSNCSVHADLSLVKSSIHTEYTQHARLSTCQCLTDLQTLKGRGRKNTFILPFRLYCGAHKTSSVSILLSRQARVS